MAAMLIQRVVTVLLTYSLLWSCTNGNDHTGGKKPDSATTTATTPTPATESNTLTSPANLSANRAAAPVEQTDASGQNYTVAASGDELQIAGSKTQYDIILPADVLFDFDKTELRPEGLPILQKVKEHFATHRVNQLHVRGHTDSKGDDQYNYKLSQRRAMTVAAWLKKNIKTKGLIMSIGRGEEEPLLPNENPDGTDNPVNRQKNRRVTLSVVEYVDVNKMLNDGRKQVAQ